VRILVVASLVACGDGSPSTPPDVDAPTTCASDNECSPDVCDIGGTDTCVQCTEEKDAACTGVTPACVDNTCQPCTSHDQCDSAACLPDGSCASAGDVAYVQMGGSGSECTKMMPCGTLDDGVQANKTIVKIAAGLVKDDQVTTIDGKAVTILADPGAKLDRDGEGPILLVRSANADVSIFDLEITGGTGLADPAMQLQPNGGTPKLTLTRTTIANNQGGGISATGGVLTVAQSTISSNAGGGISVSNANFVIVGNVFFNNGTQLGSVGGVDISTSQNAANRLEFNSFNKNQAQDTLGCAVQCVAGTFTARNNIMSGNATATNMLQVSGSCAHAFSIARPGPLPPGTGNSASDPLFVNTTTGDLHVMAGSPALGAADPASDLTGAAEFDIDEQKRASPSDIGADEVP
jgi:hypothetical protein